MTSRIKILDSVGKQLLFALILSGGITSSFFVRAEILAAQWEVHQVQFRYTGFSTHYTCDGVERKLKRLLKLLGARDDARVETKCINHARIQRIHRLRLAFAMPVPADETDISREVIPAEWQKVRVVGKLSRYLDSGDCELLEHFRRYVLPYLQIRSTDKSLHCAPHRRESNNLGLNITALKALEKTELEGARDPGTGNIPQTTD